VPNSNAVGQNRLLTGLDAGDFARLEPNLKKVRLTLGTLLHPVGKPIEHVYFPLNGMVSMLTVMKSGEQIETAIIGSEGVVGGWVAIDGRNANIQSTVQIEGWAWQIPTRKFLDIYRTSEPFRSAMNWYQGIILFQAQQSAGCHAIHSIESRFCRWLLFSQDLLGSDQVPLTQEFLSHMLGVRRTSVSLCAHALQKSGLIKYTRGNIKILNREGLEDCACECYSVLREHMDIPRPTPLKGELHAAGL
jgi:CRP-like cAMP-binding protein